MITQTEMPALLDTRDAARLLGLSKSFLEHDRLRPALGIPYIKLGGVVRYDPQGLMEWARARVVNPLPAATAPQSDAPVRRRGRPRKAL